MKSQTIKMKKLTLIGIFVFTLISFSNAQTKIPVIIDADTGNEVDDLYALSRALIEPSWDILALNATHWQTSHWAIENSMENSHRLNGVILGHLGLDIKTRRGGVARMFDWGDQAQHSAAAYEIIKQAQAMPEGEKLTIVALGALTNIGSALFVEPSIVDKIKLYWLGTTYDFEKGILGTNDFNCVMDIQALHLILKSELELNVIPLDVAAKMDFTFEETVAQFEDKHGLGDLLVDRWETHLDGLRKNRVIWDVALIEAVIHPEWATIKNIKTSKDFGNREVNYYSDIEVEKMKTEFFEVVNEYMSE